MSHLLYKAVQTSNTLNQGKGCKIIAKIIQKTIVLEQVQLRAFLTSRKYLLDYVHAIQSSCP